MRNYYNAQQKKIAAGVKGDLVIKPVLLVYESEVKKDGKQYVYLVDNDLWIPAESRQLYVDHDDLYADCYQYVLQIRYADNPKMKNAQMIPDAHDAYYYELGKYNKKKKYYMQVRSYHNDHCGVLYSNQWSEVVKVQVKGK